MKHGLAGLLGLTFCLVNIGANGQESENRTVALIAAVEETSLSSTVNGTIKTVHVARAQKVKKGALLVELNCDVYNAQAAAARAEYKAAKAEYDNNATLKEYGATTETETALLAAKKEKAQAQLNEAYAIAEQCKIVAPYDGVVKRKIVNTGQMVSPGDELIELRSEAIHVITNVPSVWYQRIRAGTVFTTHFRETDKKYTAVVDANPTEIDAAETIEVYARIEDPNNELLPGMIGEACFHECK